MLKVIFVPRAMGTNNITFTAANHALSVLRSGRIQLKGIFQVGSNYTFLVEVNLQGESLEAVYKPTKGEKPLWDFPSGTLAKREVAAYLISEALGWGLVPPTVLRKNGPYGLGSVQLFVDFAPDGHYFNFTDTEREICRSVAAFDYVINNADRKGGHIVRSNRGHIQLIDHGVCFHYEEKLRAVLWDFAGEKLSENMCSDITDLATSINSFGKLRNKLSKLLSTAEINALSERATGLVASGCLPQPGLDYNYPWPML